MLIKASVTAQWLTTVLQFLSVSIWFWFVMLFRLTTSSTSIMFQTVNKVCFSIQASSRGCGDSWQNIVVTELCILMCILMWNTTYKRPLRYVRPFCVVSVCRMMTNGHKSTPILPLQWREVRYRREYPYILCGVCSNISSSTIVSYFYMHAFQTSLIPIFCIQNNNVLSLSPSWFVFLIKQQIL